MIDYNDSNITEKLQEALKNVPSVNNGDIQNYIKSCAMCLTKQGVFKYNTQLQQLSLLNALSFYLINFKGTSNTSLPSTEIISSVDVFMSDLNAILHDNNKQVDDTVKAKIVSGIQKSFKLLENKIQPINVSSKNTNETNKSSETKEVKSKTNKAPKLSDMRKNINSRDKTTSVVDNNPNHVTYDDIKEEWTFCLPEMFASEQYFYIQKAPYTGIWHIAHGKGVRIKQLTNYYIEVLNVVTKAPDSILDGYTLTLRLTNVNGESMTVTLNKEQMERHKLGSLVYNFGIYPTSLTDKQRLETAIRNLSSQKHVSHQYEADNLGWNINPLDGKKVWVLSNGCETLDGFKDITKAPFYAPNIPDHANGYTGAIVNKPNDDIMHLLLEELNPHIQVINAALLGLTSDVQLPIGKHIGYERFVTEIMGKTRHGKSVLVNFFLSSCGTSFDFNMPTLLSASGGSGMGDSKLGRTLNLNVIKYNLGTDFDNKCKPNDSQYDTFYKKRNDTNIMYADRDGRTVSTRDHKAKITPVHYGALIRTGETDYAKHMKHTNNDSTELRVCTFVWECDCTEDAINPNCQYVSNASVSEQIDSRRTEIYAWFQAYRHWIMSQSEEKLTTIYKESQKEAYRLVCEKEWGIIDLPKQQTYTLVTGLLMWKQFLKMMHPLSFMINWIDTQVPMLIENRYQRYLYVARDVKKELIETTVNDVLTCIRIVLHNGTGFIKKQNDTFIESKDILELSFAMEDLGYKEERKVTNTNTTNKPNTPNAKKMYIAHGELLGYLKSNKEYIAFNTTSLIAKIKTYADRNNIKIGTRDEILTALEQADCILIEQGKTQKYYDHQIKINGRKDRKLHLSINKLFPVFDNDGIEEETEDVNDDIPDNVTDITEHLSKQDDSSDDTPTEENNVPTQPKQTKKRKRKVSPDTYVEPDDIDLLLSSPIQNED